MLTVLTGYFVAMLSRAPMLLRATRSSFVPIVVRANPNRVTARKRLQSKRPLKVYNVEQDRESGEFILVLARPRSLTD